MTGRGLRADQWRGVAGLTEREVLRVLRLWTQTIAPQVVAAVLFIVVFGIALGGRLRDVGGVPYDQFIVPGLTLMGIATAGFANNASSLYQARSDGFIEDPGTSPMTARHLLTAYMSGGVVRGVLIGAATLAASRLFVDFPIVHPLVAIAAFLCASVAFAALGTIVGLYARGWDQQAFVGNLVIQPLVFLGGVFYSLSALSQPWRALSHADPIYYLVASARYGMLGGAEINIGLALGVSAALAAALTAWAWALFARGTGIRT